MSGRKTNCIVSDYPDLLKKKQSATGLVELWPENVLKVMPILIEVEYVNTIKYLRICQSNFTPNLRDWDIKSSHKRRVSLSGKILLSRATTKDIIP